MWKNRVGRRIGLRIMLAALSLSTLPSCKNSFSEIIPNDGAGCEPLNLIKVPDLSNLAIKVGEQYTFAVIPSGGCGALTQSWSLDNSPLGVTTPDYNFKANDHGLGSYVLEAKISDGTSSSVVRWNISVVVTGLSVAGASPVAGNFTVNEGSSQSFQGYFTGGNGNPLLYSVTINGTPVGSTASYTWVANSFVAGNFTLRIGATDGASSAEVTWLVKNNYAPVVSAFLPITAPVRVAYDGSQAFSVTAADANGDSLSYSWYVDGDPNVILATTSSATWTNPGLSFVGTRTVRVVVTDGTASKDQSWTVMVNHFFQECNTLTSGKVCTHAGDPDTGSGLNPTDFPAGVRVQPRHVFHSSSNDVTFVADNVSHAIYAWNRSASATTLFGQSLNPGQIKVVAGSGVAGFTGDGGQALDAQFNAPMGVVYYGGPTNPGMYVADYNNNRIRYVSPGGFITTVPAIATDCANPSDLKIRGSRIYIACYGDHLVLSYDIETAVLSHELGFDSAAPWGGTASNSTASLLGDGAAPMSVYLRNPSAIEIDQNNNLYVYGSGDCRLWFLNKTASPVMWYGAISVSPNTARVIGGSTLTGAGSTSGNWCGNTLGGAPYSNTNVGYFQNGFAGLAITNFSGGMPREIFIATTNSHDVRVINATGSSKLYGSVVTVPNNSVGRVVGNGANAYLNDNVDAATSRLNAPHSLFIDPITGRLFIADHNNFRVRWLNLSTWIIDRVFGAGYGRADNFGGAALPVRENYFNNPVAVAHDSNRNSYYFADMSNHVIRKVDLATGLSSTITGFGNGASLSQDDVPTNVFMNNPQALTIHGNGLVYADTNNCAVRVHNLGASSATFFGVTIASNRVSSIAGSPGNCSSTGSGGAAISAYLNLPSGVASDGTNLYVSERGSHCIRRINAAGTISDFAGACGTSGTAPIFPSVNTAANLRLNSPEQLAISSDGVLVVADRGNNLIRAINTGASAVTIGGNSIAAGSAATVAGGGASTGDGAIGTGTNIGTVYGVFIDANRIYFASESQHNVRSFLRTTGATNTLFGRASGSGGRAGSPFDLNQEGANSTDAFLFNPRGITMMGTTLLISDRSNHLIRMVQP